MSYYPDVKPGDDWKPEPAPRYNAVNRMLGDLGYSGAGRGASGIENFNIVSTVNRHTAAISAGMAVEAVSAPADADVPVIPVKPSAGASGAFYGVALDTLEPGDVGRMLLTGVATVQLSSAPAAGTQYVEPDSANPGKFKAATGGRARVLVTAGTTATVMLGGGGGDSGYNGYFKITDASEGDAFKVKVADGATGGASTCKVNNIVFSVPAWTSEAITATRLIVLKYTAKTSGQDAKVELVLLETLPNDDNLNCYYQIGRAIVDRNGGKIQQDHNAASSNGIAQIYWYNLCDQ